LLSSSPPAARRPGAEGRRFGDILGSADALILDEAHQIPDLATRLRCQLSSRRIENVVRDVQANVAGAVRIRGARGKWLGWTGLGGLRAVSAACIDCNRPAAPTGPFAWADAPQTWARWSKTLRIRSRSRVSVGAAGDDSPLSKAAERISDWR